jgi:predicted DNA-binding protein
MKLKLKEKKASSCKKCGGMILETVNWWQYEQKGIHLPTYFCKNCHSNTIKEINQKYKEIEMNKMERFMKKVQEEIEKNEDSIQTFILGDPHNNTEILVSNLFDVIKLANKDPEILMDLGSLIANYSYKTLKKGDKLMNRKSNYRFRVSKIEDNKVDIVPAGGGEVYQDIPIDLLKKEFKIVDEFPFRLKEDRATIEGMDDKYYKCLTDPKDRWNGWAKPYFSKEVIKKFIADADDLTIKEEKADEIVITNGEGNLISATKDSNDLWQLRNGCWMWELESDYEDD